MKASYFVIVAILVLLLNATSFSEAGLLHFSTVSQTETFEKNQEHQIQTFQVQATQALGNKSFGMHLPQSPWFIDKLDVMESRLGREINIVHWFGSFDYEFEAAPFENIIASGRTPLFTWQAINQPLADIVEGKHDRLITSYAQGIKQIKGPVYIRLFPEMNGQWEAWNGDTKTFTQAWHRIADLFSDQGVNNVRWVWAPNVTDHPNTPNNHMERYYPGDSYVDILGLSGYNWGTIQQDTAWTSFKDIYQTPYERLSKLTDKPIWITEIATAEQGGNKATWITEMLQNKDFPNIEAFVWFQEDKEANWTIDSSSEALSAFRSMFALASQ